MPESIEGGESFRHYPFVCGYLGPAPERRWAELVAAAPAPVSVLTSGPAYALAASSAPGLQEVAGGWCWGRYIAGRRRPRTSDEAAAELGLAGFWRVRGSTRLHTDVFGLQDVFVRELDGALYFANRLAPLRGIGDGRLTTDWDSWGSSLAFGGFIGGSTPFRQIRRLLYGETVRYGRGGLARSRSFPSWLMDPGDRGSASDVAAALRSALPSRFSPTRAAITLSGGWDSRLLAMGMVAKHARRPRAWTVDPDNGFADDLQLAPPVAAALHLRHTIVRAKASAWVRHRPTTLARTEHLVWHHTWISPLAERVRKMSTPVLDGLCGDVLLRNLFVGDQLLAAGTDHARLRVHWNYLGASRLRGEQTLVPSLVADWTDSTFEHICAAGDQWAGHPLEFTLRALTGRSARVTAASPMRLFGPEVRLILPLVTPEFVRVALSVPFDSKRKSTFYRELLSTMDPVVGPMRSTNDHGPKLPSTTPRSQASRTSIEFMAASIRSDDIVAAMLHPRLRQRLREPVAIGQLRGAPLPVLQWASALVDWRQANARFLSL